MAFQPDLFYRQKHYRCDKGEVQAPNSYVAKACYLLDGCQHVQRFQFQTVPYSFYDPDLDETRNGWIDFEVELKDKSIVLLQTMPAAFLDSESIANQVEAMELAAYGLGFAFELWTERELFGTRPDYREAIIHMLC
jgi:hypothetical protein